MLAIRLQRTGRKGHTQYRVIVQDSRFSPKSARVVNYLGSYDPHTKKAVVDTETAEKYLNNGAQPSDRVASILKESGVKLPKWYSEAPKKKKAIKNPEKLRKNRPEQPAEEATEAPTVDKVEPADTADEPTAEQVTEEAVNEEPVASEEAESNEEEKSE